MGYSVEIPAIEELMDQEFRTFYVTYTLDEIVSKAFPSYVRLAPRDIYALEIDDPIEWIENYYNPECHIAFFGTQYEANYFMAAIPGLEPNMYIPAIKDRLKV